MSTFEASLEQPQRPHHNLLIYYALQSLLLGPFFPFMLLPLYFRYRSLRYRFDDEGVTMRWGVLFSREVSLTYGRIQDIHLASNLVERWLGLARVQVQTASGAAAAEMTIEGLPAFAEIRDFLYQRMRGAKGAPRRAGRGAEEATPEPAAPDELTRALRETAAELRALRRELAGRRPEAGP